MADNIFALCNRNADEPKYVEAYISYLASLHEDHNIRATLKSAVERLPAEKARRIWEIYTEFEVQHGSLNEVWFFILTKFWV